MSRLIPPGATTYPLEVATPTKEWLDAVNSLLFAWRTGAIGGGGGGQVPIQFRDEGSNLGTSGTVDVVDFTGDGVTASRTGNTVTVNVPTPPLPPYIVQVGNVGYGTFLASHGAGASIGGYGGGGAGLGGWAGINILGHNPPNPTASDATTRTLNVQFFPDTYWGVYWGSNSRPFFQRKYMSMSALVGNKEISSGVLDNWLFGMGDSGVILSPPPQNEFFDFLGFVSVTSEANIRIMIRNGGLTTLNLNTGIAKLAINSMNRFRIQSNSNASTYTLSIDSWNPTSQEYTNIYNTNVSASLLEPTMSYAPVIGGSGQTGIYPSLSYLAGVYEL